MTRKADWEKFFDSHAPVYMENCFTRNTINEVDFLIEEPRLKPGATILDVGCGMGRHAVELARRGYTVSGVDISSGMLAEARKHAEGAVVAVTLVHANAAHVIHRGVQRGEAPLHFFSFPQEWGIKGG